MTIAAGFVCLDGIVLCADTQETITGYTKNSTEKIRTWQDRGLCIATTGAGDTDLIETIGEEIERSLYCEYDPRAIRFPGKVREIIHETMVSAFRRYVLPYSSFPKEDRPWCDLLTVVTVKNEVNNYQCLFKASGTTVRQIEPGAECVGTGLILAKSLIERFYSPFMGLDELVLAACYIMRETKKWVDGCGGKTDLIVSSYQKNIFSSIPSLDTEELERQFEKLGDVNSLLFDFVNPNISDSRIGRTISVLKNTAASARKELYPKDGRLLDMLKKLDREAPKPKP